MTNAVGEPAARLAALRDSGACRFDPLRFAYLEALQRRMEGQPAAVRAALEGRLAGGLADYERLAAATPPRAPAPAPAPTPRGLAATPLASLQARLRDAAAARAAACAPGEVAPEHELASALRFRQAWLAGRTLEQVDQALQRRPANAGPLNSHALVLHSLALMRELSPAYLGRFLAVVESLQWLEQAGAAPAPVLKPNRKRGRPPRSRAAAP